MVAGPHCKSQARHVLRAGPGTSSSVRADLDSADPAQSDGKRFFFFIFIILKPLKQTPGVSDPKKWGNNLDRMIFLGAMLRGLELHLLCCSYTCVYMCRIRREYTVDLRPPPRAPHESPQRFCSRHPLPNNALV